MSSQLDKKFKDRILSENHDTESSGQISTRTLCDLLDDWVFDPATQQPIKIKRSPPLWEILGEMNWND